MLTLWPGGPKALRSFAKLNEALSQFADQREKCSPAFSSTDTVKNYRIN